MATVQQSGPGGDRHSVPDLELERRRTALLMDCLQELHSSLQIPAVLDALVTHTCELFAAKFVSFFQCENETVRLKALAAATPESAAELRARLETRGCENAAQVTRECVAAGSAICVHLERPPEGYEDLIPGGEVLATPVRSARSGGGMLVYAGPETRFSEEDRALLRAVADMASLAISNAELYSQSSAQAHELRQLLEISAQLGGAGELPAFLDQFVVRAAEFLGFRRSFIALRNNGPCRIMAVAEGGVARRTERELRAPVSLRVLDSKRPVSCENLAAEPGGADDLGLEGAAKQFLGVPLQGGDGEVLGIFAVLDREDQRPISSEDVRRATALASEVALALQAMQNLHLSREHRARAENLMGLALELSSSFRLPDFVRNFTERAAEMLGARAAVLALAQAGQLEIVYVHSPGAEMERALQRRLHGEIGKLAQEHPQPVYVATPAEMQQGVLAELAWHDLMMARLTGTDGELLGVLCLADRGLPVTVPDANLLQALAAHASVALENSQLFSRITQSSKQWAEIFDAITDFIVVHDEGNRVLRVNRSLAEFIGLHPSELVGLSMRALVSLASDFGGLACPFCRSGEGADDEYIHPVLERTYLVSTSRVHGAGNEGLQTIHVLKDITDRREAERRYHELFENVQEGVFFSSPEGRFIEVNEAMVKMLGYGSREELLQIDISTQLYLAPDQRLRFKQAIESAGMVRNFEQVFRRKDGSVIHTLQNAVAVRDTHGNVIQYRGVILDITELKAFQSQLQREHDFNDKILNNTRNMILVADTAGLISYANRRCYDEGHFAETELVGKPLRNLVAAPRRDDFVEAFESTLGGRQVDNLELPIVKGDARTGQFSLTLSPMRDEHGNITSTVVVMTDITDAAMIQAKLMHTEKMAAVGQLVSGVAHEVNNPLTAILGFADLMLENPETPDSARKDLRVIIQEAQRTKMIVQNLLSFARQTPPVRKPVHINLVLRRTLQLRAYDFSSHGVEVVERLPDSIPEVVGDAHQLQQVFLNILNNAYDAVRETGRTGRIEVTSAAAEGCLEVSFRDNGNGISHPDRIFDPFFTTKEVGKGTGLGLSICYGIVNEHGGEIFCRNNTDGPGATFTVRLPLVGLAAVPVAAGAQA
jgi:PAS domain S-box-containing protein